MNKIVKDIKKFVNKLNNMSNKHKIYLLIITMGVAVLFNKLNKLNILKIFNIERFSVPATGISSDQQINGDPWDTPRDVFVMFSLSTCPYCKEAKPIFNNLPNTHKVVVVDENGIDVESSVDDATGKKIITARDNLTPKRFPTFKLYKTGGGDPIEYTNSTRTKIAFEEFLKNN